MQLCLKPSSFGFLSVDATPEALGLASPDYYYYLNQSGTYTVDGINDVDDYNEMRVRIIAPPPPPWCQWTSSVFWSMQFGILVSVGGSIFLLIAQLVRTRRSRSGENGAGRA